MDLGSDLGSDLEFTRNDRKCIFLSGDADGSDEIDAYTGGLAELPVQGGLVRFFLLRTSLRM